MIKFFIRKKLVLITFFLFGLSWASFSQEKLSLNQLETTWTLYSEIDGIQIYTKKEKSANSSKEQPSEYLLFRIVNSSQLERTVGYNIAFFSNENCLNCGSNECYSAVVLKPQQTVEGTINNTCSCLAAIISNPNLKSIYTISYFQIINLTIK